MTCEFVEFSGRKVLSWGVCHMSWGFGFNVCITFVGRDMKDK